MTQLMVPNGSTDVERPARNWKYPYAAAAFDWGGGIQMSVGKDSSRAVGYAITPAIHLSSNNRTALGFMDEFLEQHDIEPNIREKGQSWRLELNRREDIEYFCRLVEPYVIANAEPIRVMLKHLLPALNLGKQSDKEGFLQVVEYADEIRQYGRRRNEPKYDADYFRDEWGL